MMETGLQPGPMPEPPRNVIVFVCIRCKRISYDKCNWYAPDPDERTPHSAFENTICTGCSKQLCPQFYV
jgi:hypothetical protein